MVSDVLNTSFSGQIDRSNLWKLDISGQQGFEILEGLSGGELCKNVAKIAVGFQPVGIYGVYHGAHFHRTCRHGGRMCTIDRFNVDDRFSNVLDGLILVDLFQTDIRLLRKYMGPENAESFLEYHNKRLMKRSRAS